MRIVLMVPDVRPANPEDHVFSDVRRMISNALQIARDHQRIQCLCGKSRLLLDQNRERVICSLIHLVDLVVHRQHSLRHLRIAFDK